MKDANSASMKRVLSQIMDLCRTVDGGSLKGLKEPMPGDDQAELEASPVDQQDDAKKLLALKAQEDEG